MRKLVQKPVHKNIATAAVSIDPVLSTSSYRYDEQRPGAVNKKQLLQ